MHENLYLLGDVARMLGVKPHRIVYLFTSNKISDVPMLGNRRVFSAADVSRVSKAFGIKIEQITENKKETI